MKLGRYEVQPLDYLVLLAPVVLVGKLLGWPAPWLFGLSALTVIPLAGLMGTATEELAAHLGPHLGGLLNATLGNAAELIITVFAIQRGLLELVKASITGSILGNLLLVLGMSLLAGGLKHGTQTFNRRHAATNSTLALLALAGLAIPSLFIPDVPPGPRHDHGVQFMSLGVAVMLMLIYGLSIVYSFTARDQDTAPVTLHPTHTPLWSARTASVVLLVATLGIAWLSEVLVGAVEATVAALGWSEYFIGIIVVPLVGNVAEHAVAVQTALKDKMDLSLAVSLGSSLQIALFVAPLLVFISLALGRPLLLDFGHLEVVALLAAGGIAAVIAEDGESNWLEGAMLLVLYVILAVGFFFEGAPH